MNITPTSVADLSSMPGFDLLLEQYAAECANTDIGDARDADINAYSQLEAAGLLVMLAVIDGIKVVGFAVVRYSDVPKYNRKVAHMMDVFLSPASRQYGVGRWLVREAEAMARDHGAAAFVIGCGSNSTLSALAPRLGYRETSRLFSKSL